MKLVVGLGNPGPEYEATKHNIGFWVVDAFCLTEKIAVNEKIGQSFVGRGIDFLIAKPQTFMNRSGIAVKALLSKFQINPADLILIQDDLDRPCGAMRIRTQGSAGGHRGVASVIDMIGSDQFVRIKIGIGRDPSQSAADYVLTRFKKADQQQALEGVQRSVEALPLLLAGRITEAMNRFNS